MSYVRFATLCDVCKRRSLEYNAWPCCRECLRDICHGHQVPDTHDEESGRCLCIDCSFELEGGLN